MIERLNVGLMKIGDKPILTLLEKYKRKTLGRINERHIETFEWNQPTPLKVSKIVDKGLVGCSSVDILCSGDMKLTLGIQQQEEEEGIL